MGKSTDTESRPGEALKSEYCTQMQFQLSMAWKELVMLTKSWHRKNRTVICACSCQIGDAYIDLYSFN